MSEYWRVDAKEGVCPLTGRTNCEGCKFYMQIPTGGAFKDYNCLIGQIAYRLEQIMRSLGKGRSTM